MICCTLLRKITLVVYETNRTHTHTHTFLVLLYCGVKRLFVACDTLWFCIWQLMFISSLIQPSFSQLLQPTFQPTFQPAFQLSFQPTFQPTFHPAFRKSIQPKIATWKIVKHKSVWKLKCHFFFASDRKLSQKQKDNSGFCRCTNLLFEKTEHYSRNSAFPVIPPPTRLFVT